MSYSTKFASQFYGPFRAAAGSAPQFGDRASTIRSTCDRGRDAMQSSVRCANEGADLLMVKPGMTSLDLIAPIREATGQLVGAYQVSGEYAGLCALGRATDSRISTRRCSRPGTSCAVPARPTSSPTAPAARGRWESWHDRSRGVCTRARSTSRPAACTVPCARFVASAACRFSCSAGRGARSLTSAAATLHRLLPELRSADSRPSRSGVAPSPCTTRSTTAGRMARASRTRWRWPSGSSRACHGSSGCGSSRRAPKR